MGCQLPDQQVTNNYHWRNLISCPSSLIRGFPRLAIALWIRNNFVSLQSTKCSAMLLTRKRSSQVGVTTPILHIEDSPLPYVSPIKYLGILITPDLCRSQHIISNIHLRARQLIGMFYWKFYKNAQPPTLLQLFTRPHLEYCTAVWDPYLTKDIELATRKDPEIWAKSLYEGLVLGLWRASLQGKCPLLG